MVWRRFIHLIVFVVWLGSLLVFQQRVSSREFLNQGARIDIADGDVLLRKDDLVLYLGGMPSGMATFELEEFTPPTGVQSEKLLKYDGIMNLRISALGARIGMNIQSTGVVNPDLTLRRINASFKTMDSQLQTEALRFEDHFLVSVTSKGNTQQTKVPAIGPVYSADVAHLVVAKRGLQPGSVYRLNVYEPFTRSVGEYKLTVQGPRKVETVDGPIMGIELLSEFQKVESTFVINQNGDMLYQQAQMAGIPFSAIREREAMQGILPTPQNDGAAGGDGLVDLLAQSMMISNVLIERPEDVKRMVVTMKPIEREDLILDGKMQELLKHDPSRKAMRVLVRSPHFVGRPPTGGGRVANSNPAGAGFVGSEPLVQSDDPRIIQATRKVTRGARGTWDAAEKIGEYLYAKIDKSARPTIPSALEVLDSMTGDCNEHSALFCAMARSAGIPTKICSGVVYVNGQFGYHAWNEVLVGSTWLPIDSTLGRIRMSAITVKLTEGGLAQQAKIAHLIGKLEIQIEKFEYR